MITLLTILTLFSICLSQDCEVGYSSINNDCYFDQDLDVLNTFINNSNGSINMILDTNNNGIIESLELCSQEWGNGRIYNKCDVRYIITFHVKHSYPRNSRRAHASQHTHAQHLIDSS